ncbi:MAG: hypothetical protein PHE89_00270 [Alphaproteobacteria bacterium]|nr:hypothetical protein [Alphaproteobacteria bacterium]
MKPTQNTATSSLDETLANLVIKNESEAQQICKSAQPFYLAEISVKEPDENKAPETIIGWISNDEYLVVDALTEKRYSALNAEFQVLNYL